MRAPSHWFFGLFAALPLCAWGQTGRPAGEPETGIAGDRPRIWSAPQPPTVNPCDIYHPNEVDTLNGRRMIYSLTRPGPGYRLTSSGAEMAPADAGLFRSVAICSMSDGMREPTLPDGTYVNPAARNSRYVFGIRDQGGLYRSTNGRDWAHVSSAVTSNLIALSDDALLRTEKIDNRLTVFRSDDDGKTWVRATWADSGEPFAWKTEGAWLVHWGVHEADNGTLVMVEYKLPGNTRYVYRSTDGGRSWRDVFDMGAGGLIKHYHAVVKHEALGRWVISTGDGLAQQTLLISDDDGQSWSHYTALGQIHAQPTYLLDFGHPTRLLMGSDLAWQVAWIDISDGPDARRIESAITNWDTRVSAGYCWSLWQHNGTFYAPQYDGRNVWDKDVVLSVSNDLEHWAVLHLLEHSDRGILSNAGLAGGRFQAIVAAAQTLYPFTISPVELSLQPGLVVGQAAPNLAAAIDSAGDVAAWENRSEAGAADPAYRGALWCGAAAPLEGAGALYYSRNDGGRMLLRSPAVTANGSPLQARLWLRGSAATATVRWVRNGAETGEGQWFGLSDRWREMTLPVLTTVPGDQLRVQVLVYSTLDNVCEVRLDGLQIQNGTSTFWASPGGDPAEQRAHSNLTAGPDWTNVFFFEPDNSSLMMKGAAPAIVKTWTFGPADRTELRYDPAQARFQLQSLVRGSWRTPAVSAPQVFPVRAQLRFALRVSNACVSLAFANAGPIQRIYAEGPSTTAGQTVQVTFGGADGNDAFAGAVVNDMLYDGFLSEDAVFAAMNELDPEPAVGDLNLDRRCNIDDLMVILGAFGDPLRGDADGDGASDLNDLLVVIGNLGRISP